MESFVEKSELLKIAATCADTEFVVFHKDSNNNCPFHTDYINSMIGMEMNDLSINELPDEIECYYEIMDEDDYNHSICANSCIRADFEDWYGDQNAKVLVIGFTSSVAIAILNQIRQ